MFIPRSGGAMATRLRGDLTLVIETQPGQPTQYCFSDERRQQDLDHEGKASGDQDASVAAPKCWPTQPQNSTYDTAAQTSWARSASSETGRHQKIHS